MYLCDDGHDEVCFEGRNCPACTLKDELNGRIKSLESDLKEARDEIDELSKAE